VARRRARRRLRDRPGDGEPATALVAVASREVATVACFTAEGLAALGRGFGTLLAATLGWGLLGPLLAMLLRSPAAAVGAGLASALPFELLVGSTWDDSAR
jgi:hypothetical protein